MPSFLLVLIYLAIEATALVFAFKAVRTARTSQGAVGWVVFLLSLPLVAVPAYMFLGTWRFRGYVVARREDKQIIDGIKEHAELDKNAHLDNGGTMRALETIAGLPVTSGAGMSVLIDGQQTFDTIFNALDEAKEYVLVQFYIIHDDTLGRALQERLIACSERGVSVRFLFDAVGCHKLPESYLAKLRLANVEVVNIHEQTGPKTRFQINFRNHRKTVVVDGIVGFTGGFNVGDEYMSRDSYFGNWRDTHCRLTGPIVSQLQLVFAEDWYWATGNDLRDALNWKAPHSDENMKGLIVATGPADKEEYGTLFFCAMINASTTRLWIASPYMVPENDVLIALKLAALRGVDVRLLVPDMVDHWLPWLAALAYFDELNDAGVQIWRYTNGFMHQKVVLVDDEIAAIGTTNLDNRSCRLNFEAMAVLFDRSAAKDVFTMFEADFHNAYLLQQKLLDRKFFERHAAPIARLFAPLL